MGDRNSLHRLLDDLNDIHKKDMKDVACGHLNENKLWKRKEQNRTKIWDSASKSPVWLRKKVDVKNHPICAQLPPLEKNVKEMNDAVIDFMLGPNESNASPTNTKERKKKKKADKIKFCSNETMLPHTMLPVSPRNKANISSKRCVPTHLIFPTKLEQYQQLRKVQQDLVSDDIHQGDNRKTVENTEKTLRKRLKDLERKHDISGPNFFKLKAYSDAWDDLCNTSDTYGLLMKSVKDDYDAYVNGMLDMQIKYNQPLEDHMHLLTLQNEDLPSIKKDEETVKDLEYKIMEELKENERLRKRLRHASENKESLLSSFLKKDDKLTKDLDQRFMDNLNNKEKTNDLERKVEALHAQIELQLHELDTMKKDQQENYVPAAVCQRVEHCIKETEVDIQKLCKQNEFLEHNIEELEEELESVLVRTGIKDKDARLLWRRVNTSRLLDM